MCKDIACIITGQSLAESQVWLGCFPCAVGERLGKAALEPSFHLFSHPEHKMSPLLMFSDAGAIVKHFSVFALVLNDRCSKE